MSWPEWLQPHIDSFVQWVNGVLEYWDLDYLEYLIWLFLPIFIAFVVPIFLLFFCYGCVIFLHIYGLRHRIREAYASSYWDGARTSIAGFWDGVGVLWHGYELRGLENLPTEGPGLIIAYHGTLPLDLYYVIAKGILYTKRTIHLVGDKFVFKIPGWGKMCKVFCITPGTVDDCIANLAQGNLLIIAPGGVREALFSNPVTYEIMWGRRLGFAKVVLGANVPVIPMFTENCREAFRTPRWCRRICRPLYERTRLPLCPIYGGFPVKMITHLGEPLNFPPTATPEQIKFSVRNALSDMIQAHQVLPGSILRALLQRVRKKRQKGGGGRGGSSGSTTLGSGTAENGVQNADGKEDGGDGSWEDERAKQRRRRRQQEVAAMEGQEAMELRPCSREIARSPLLLAEPEEEDDEEREAERAEKTEIDPSCPKRPSADVEGKEGTKDEEEESGKEWVVDG